MPMRLSLAACAAAFVAGSVGFATPASACGDSPYVGAVCTFAMSYCPVSYLPADGRSLPITQNQVLYALIGNFYGGDGRQTFNLPDLRGRAPVGTGQGQGLQPVSLAQPIGQPQVTLTATQTPLPPHTHPATFQAGTQTQQVTVPAQAGNLAVAINALSAPGNGKNPGGNLLAAVGGLNANIYGPPGSGTATLAAQSTTVTGTAGSPQIQFNVPVGGTVSVAPAGQPAGQPVPTQSPALGMTVCIAVQGQFPPRP